MNHFQWRPKERPCYLINGEFCADSELPFSHFNRGFLYSDGFFETVRICNGIPQHLALHWNRISSSLRAHRMENKQGLTEKQLGHRLQELCERNAINQGGRVRITIFRNGGGRYRPESNEMAWIATAEPLQDNLLISEEKGLNVDLYSGMQKQVNPLSNLKTCHPTSTFKPHFGLKKRDWMTHSFKTKHATSLSRRIPTYFLSAMAPYIRRDLTRVQSEASCAPPPLTSRFVRDTRYTNATSRRRR